MSGRGATDVGAPGDSSEVQRYATVHLHLLMCTRSSVRLSAVHGECVDCWLQDRALSVHARRVVEHSLAIWRDECTES